MKLSNVLRVLFLFLLASTSFAYTIIVQPNTVISHSTKYNNVTLDMTKGSFIVEDNASLTITNSVVHGTLSVKNPVLFNVDQGSLYFRNNQVYIESHGVEAHPTTQALQYVIQLAMATNFELSGNSFEIDKPFTSGVLVTTASIPTSGIKIQNNKFNGFHGVLYLVGTDKALISGNRLVRNTYGNIVVIGSHSSIIGNTIEFAGNNRLGNSIDVIDSNDIEVSKNILLTPTCHGIYVFNSRNVLVDDNRIFGGITYALNVLTYPEKLISQDQEYLKGLLGNYHLKNMLSSNVTISNNFISQNRYGLAANDVDGLHVHHNMFIQRFEDNETRKFWTNNSILLQNVTNLNWENNLYKEAYSQAEEGDNSKTFIAIPFPKTGGVVYPF